MTRGSESRKEAAKKFIAHVNVVLDEAQAAAAAAFSNFVATANLDKTGHPIDSMGSGDIIVFKPSYRLREALKALGEVQRDNDGAWWISNFRKYGNQSLTAAEKTCEAAR